VKDKTVIYLIISVVAVVVFYWCSQTIINEEIFEPIPESIILSLNQSESYTLGTFSEGTFEGKPYTSAGQIYTVNIKSLFKGTKKANFVMENDEEQYFSDATVALHNGNFSFVVPHGNWSFYVINNNKQNIKISVKVDVRLPVYSITEPQ